MSIDKNGVARSIDFGPKNVWKKVPLIFNFKGIFFPDIFWGISAVFPQPYIYAQKFR